MKKIFLAVLLALGHFFCCAQGKLAAPVASTLLVFNTIEEMTAAKTAGTVAIVKDPQRGGNFIYSKDKNRADNGVIFPAPDKGYWIRTYNAYEGVDIAWFGAKMDSASSDVDALKSAFRYDHVCITGAVRVAGKFTFPEGKTISFTSRGSIILADSAQLNFDAYLKAEDYSYIFRGNGNVLFGQRSTPYVSPCWFGATADYAGPNTKNPTDNQPAIQKAIVAAEKVSDVYLPPSPACNSYRIASGVTIFKKIHFYSFKFHGGGTTITGSSFDKATTIFADFTTGPAINIQGSRRSYISDFRLTGKNAAPGNMLSDKWTPSYSTAILDTISNFYDSAVRKSYAGIATDAEKDNKVWSADIQFDRLQIQGFFVGISINDAGNLQGDRMRVNNSQIAYCTYGISVGNPQARACNFENVDMNYVYIGYTNYVFGLGTGSEFQITGGQYCNLYKLFHIQPCNLGQCVVTGLYAECLGSIGEIGYFGPNDNSFIFNGCYFSLYDATTGNEKGMYSKYYTLTAFANVSFQGCNFWTLKPYLAMCAGSDEISFHPLINFSGCTFYRSSFFHGWGNVNIERSHFAPLTEKKDLNQTIRTRLDGNRRYNTGFYATTAIPLFDGISTDSVDPPAARQIMRTIPMFYSVQDGTAMRRLSANDDTLTFSYNSELETKLFRYCIPGDILGTTLKGIATKWDNPTLKVISIDHDSRKVTVTSYTETFTLDKIALYTNCFFTTTPITGNISTVSNLIPNVRGAQHLQEGDFITFSNAARPYRISKVDPTMHTITLFSPISEGDSKDLLLYNLQLSGVKQ